MRRGMTLVEVVCALWILFLVAAMAAGILHRALRHNTQQEHATRAAFLASQRMEELMLVPPRLLTPDSGYFEAPFGAYQWRLGVQPLEEGEFLLITVTVKGPAESAFTLRTHRRGWSNQLWYASNRNEKKKARLYQVFEDGLDAREIPTRGEGLFNDLQPTLSPDGREVVFVSDREKGRQLYRMPVDSSDDPVRLTEFPMGAQEPAWSPDGRFLAFTAVEGGFSQVFLRDMKTGATENISHRKEHEGGAVWSPDGNMLAFVATDTSRGGSRLGLMHRNGEGRRFLTNEPGWNTSPCFSPSGRQLAFMSSRDGDPEIFVMDLEAFSPRQVTSNNAYDTEPRFSPDGKRLVFWSTRDGGAQLYLMRPDGSDVRPVIRKEEALPGTEWEKHPCWLPVARAGSPQP